MHVEHERILVVRIEIRGFQEPRLDRDAVPLDVETFPLRRRRTLEQCRVVAGDGASLTCLAIMNGNFAEGVETGVGLGNESTGAIETEARAHGSCSELAREVSGLDV